MRPETFTKIIAFRVPRRLFSEIEQHAKNEDRSASYVVRQIIADALNYDLRKTTPTAEER